MCAEQACKASGHRAEPTVADVVAPPRPRAAARIFNGLRVMIHGSEQFMVETGTFLRRAGVHRRL